MNKYDSDEFGLGLEKDLRKNLENILKEGKKEDLAPNLMKFLINPKTNKVDLIQIERIDVIEKELSSLFNVNENEFLPKTEDYNIDTFLYFSIINFFYLIDGFCKKSNFNFNFDDESQDSKKFNYSFQFVVNIVNIIGKKKLTS